MDMVSNSDDHRHSFWRKSFPQCPHINTSSQREHSNSIKHPKNQLRNIKFPSFRQSTAVMAAENQWLDFQWL